MTNLCALRNMDEYSKSEFIGDVWMKTLMLVLAVLSFLFVAGCCGFSEGFSGQKSNRETSVGQEINQITMLNYGEKKVDSECSTDKDCEDGLVFTKDSCFYTKNSFGNIYQTCGHRNTLWSCPGAATCVQIGDSTKRDQCFYKNIILKGSYFGSCCTGITDIPLQNKCVREFLDSPKYTGSTSSFLGIGCGMISDATLKSECYKKELEYVINVNGGCTELSPGNDIDSCAVAKKQCDLIHDQSKKDDCLLER